MKPTLLFLIAALISTTSFSQNLSITKNGFVVKGSEVLTTLNALSTLDDVKKLLGDKGHYSIDSTGEGDDDILDYRELGLEFSFLPASHRLTSITINYSGEDKTKKSFSGSLDILKKPVNINTTMESLKSITDLRFVAPNSFQTGHVFLSYYDYNNKLGYILILFT